MPAMDAIAAFLARLPDDVRRVGGSLPLRVTLLAVALVLNIGFYLPRVPESVPGSGVPGLDKVVHVAVFALTVWAAGRLLAARSRFPMGWVVIAALLHAVLIELLQGLVLVDGRTGDAGDLLADVVGIALGLGLWIGERLRQRRSAELGDVGTLEEAAGR